MSKREVTQVFDMGTFKRYRYDNRGPAPDFALPDHIKLDLIPTDNFGRVSIQTNYDTRSWCIDYQEDISTLQIFIENDKIKYELTLCFPEKKIEDEDFLVQNKERHDKKVKEELRIMGEKSQKEFNYKMDCKQSE